MEELLSILAASGNRLTNPRQQIFTILKAANHPLSLQELSQQVNAIDRTSIYRTLELFDRIGVIRIVHIGWKKQYELAEPFKPHHHHLQCMWCGELIDIETPTLENLVNNIADQYNYTLRSHHFELEGICSQCRS